MFRGCTSLISEPVVPSSIGIISYYCSCAFEYTGLSYNPEKQWPEDVYGGLS